MSREIRWKQRFGHFDRAMVLLREPFERGLDRLSELEKEGVIQRFEFALELGWKTIKDYMEYNRIVINPVTPRQVVKEAFAAKIISDGQAWVDMLGHRNLLSHTYDQRLFEEVLKALAARYLPAFEQVHAWLLERMTEA